ncbi:DUF1861 family protein [Lentisphaera profundi]|uniref:DUF1861 family protein n=1 Tax=Lentisphaera profundi TaxID=1658616 RepID=A0ABY7VYZ3_9BACT|nr:DUF1861 family protein [Lentisphaera profundi]WDE99004.1 DUF1861 family protein [Lentisphaera profundi]
MSKTQYADALKDFEMTLSQKSFATKKITFSGVGQKDVYNITAPFESAGKTIIAGRVESRDSEHSEVFFFEESHDQWLPIEAAPTFSLQDPFFSKINNELLIGGVEIFPAPCGTANKLSWRTIFMKGKDIYSLEKFFQGPEHMKDLRLVELTDHRIGVFTRPQGDKGGRGKIGYTEVDSLKDLSIDIVNDAPIFDQFHDDEWGGANEIHLLSNGTLGILGHIAKFSQNDTVRHYASVAFSYNPRTQVKSAMKIIASRNLFSPGEAKRPDLEDVIFSGGLQRLSNGKARLYVGAGDAEAHWLEIADPFTEWE